MSGLRYLSEELLVQRSRMTKPKYSGVRVQSRM